MPSIRPLHALPELRPVIAGWHFRQWAYLDPAHDVPMRIREFASEPPGGLPQTFVAFSAHHPVGSASVIAHDLPGREDLTPWLASVFVLPEHRRQGIASALVDHAVTHAHALGVGTLYLFTPDQMALYASLGWAPYATHVLAGEIEHIMRIHPADRVSCPR